MLFSLLGLFDSHKSNFNINIGFLGTVVAIFLASYRLEEKKLSATATKKKTQMINNETNVRAFDKSLTGWRNICERRLWDTVESQNITNN